MLVPSPLSTSQHTVWMPCMGIPSPSKGPLTQSLHRCIPLKQAGFLGKLLTGKSGEEAKKPQSNDISLIVFPSMSGLARGLRAKWCTLSQRQGQKGKSGPPFSQSPGGRRTTVKAGLLTRGSHQVQEQGGRKEGNFPGPDWEQKGSKGNQRGGEPSPRA